MSYLLDKKNKEKKFFRITVYVIIFLVFFYFRSGIWGGFSYVVGGIFRPVFVLGSSIGGKISSINSYFSSKHTLYDQNQTLLAQLNQEEARISNYNSLLAENENLKEILKRKDEKIPMVLSAILSKPNKSFYDTLVVDIGVNKGVEVGDIIFAFGNIPIGKISEVYGSSSKVVLFSSPEEETQGIISGKNISMDLVGRGGGNFEMILPRDLVLQKGDQVTMPGINPYLLAVVETIISDPRDPFIKALLVSPVNIQSLKFVEVQTQ
ncbi:rod shape-determining protein MreC [Candidatus Nomurabacteria bacterium]|nr:rod shape-determining protein MreC [Candidatus Nomurabacteria bacterium]